MVLSPRIFTIIAEAERSLGEEDKEKGRKAVAQTQSRDVIQLEALGSEGRREEERREGRREEKMEPVDKERDF